MDRPNPLASTVGAIAGVAFAALLFIGLAVVDPLREATDAELLAWWTDSDHLRESLISMYAKLAAVPFLLIFVAQLRARLCSRDPGSAWSGTLLGVGIVFAVALAVSAFARGIIVQAVELQDEPLPGVDTLRYATQLADAAMSLVAMPAGAIVLATAAALVLRTRAFGRWLGWLGLVLAAASIVPVVLLAGAFASPLIQIWVLAASFEMWRTRGATGAATSLENRRLEPAPSAQ
jgi:hypothetical protein